MLGRYQPVIVTEIEFYLFGAEGRELDSLWDDVRREVPNIAKIEQERGAEQHEISLLPTSDIESIIAQMEHLKTYLASRAAQEGMRADFSPKPKADQPGSGLHIHLHLEENGRNVFYKDDDRMSDALAYSIGGLLHVMPNDLSIFAPGAKGRERLQSGQNAPSTISWGANNRTCAIRLPDKAHDNKHIEHRVSSADADVRAVIHAILKAVEKGLSEKITPPAQIYGDASLAMYGLPKLIAG